MSKRRIRKLYDAASSAYRNGALAATTKTQERRYGDVTTYSDKHAVDVAFNAGYEAGADCDRTLPASVWSLVLAEAVRP